MDVLFLLTAAIYHNYQLVLVQHITFLSLAKGNTRLSRENQERESSTILYSMHVQCSHKIYIKSDKKE